MHSDQIEALREMASCAIPAEESAKKTAQTLFKKVENKVHTILSGPPGTGKTKLVLDMKTALQEQGVLGEFALVQFHRDYSYQDFIDGYKPSANGFEYAPGAFRQFLNNVHTRRAAEQDDRKIDLFFIDEINRADISAVFGELLTLMDDSDKKQIKTSRSETPLELPDSVILIGSMNTADKNIALMDFALRRRFSFLFVPPDYEGLRAWIEEYGFAFDDFTIEIYITATRNLNNLISSHPLLGKGMMIGQSLFVPKKKVREPFTLEEITETFSEKILTQLEAYIGYGAQHELDNLIGADIRRKLEMADPIIGSDVIGLIRNLAGIRAPQ